MTQFTSGEMTVMRILWEHGELKPAEIHAHFPRDIKNASLRSYLAILLDNRLVSGGEAQIALMGQETAQAFGRIGGQKRGATAAIKVERRLPRNSSTMISTCADSVQYAFSMYMPRWYMPNSAPASPPKAPATVKAAQRMWRVSTPMNPVRTLFSRTATSVSPNAE